MPAQLLGVFAQYLQHFLYVSEYSILNLSDGSLYYLEISSLNRRFCFPLLSKLSSANHCKNPCSRCGHSLSIIENQAVSRLRFFTTVAWRKIPSKVKPKRKAAARDAAFRAWHFHS